MTIIGVRLSERCDQAIERLRRACFVAETKQPHFRTTAMDEFDALSVHIVAQVAGQLIATCRLTPELPSVVQAWSQGQAPVPSGAGVVDVSRIVVAPALRGLGLCRLIMAETLMAAQQLGATLVVGALDPAAGHKPSFARLGFTDAGPPVLYRPLPGFCALGQTIAYHLTPSSMQRVTDQRHTAVTRLVEHGYTVVSHIAQEAYAHVEQ